MNQDARDVPKRFLNIEELLHCVAGLKAPFKIDGVDSATEVDEIAQVAVAVHPVLLVKDSQQL